MDDVGYEPPAGEGSQIKIAVSPTSKRIQLLEPFKEITSDQLKKVRVLIKAKGKCTTDHISMAGPWLEFRGHLENISNNCLIGAMNAYNGDTNRVLNFVTNEYMSICIAIISFTKISVKRCDD